MPTPAQPDAQAPVSLATGRRARERQRFDTAIRAQAQDDKASIDRRFRLDRRLGMRTIEALDPQPAIGKELERNDVAAA